MLDLSNDRRSRHVFAWVGLVVFVVVVVAVAGLPLGLLIYLFARVLRWAGLTGGFAFGLLEAWAVGAVLALPAIALMNRTTQDAVASDDAEVDAGEPVVDPDEPEGDSAGG